VMRVIKLLFPSVSQCVEVLDAAGEAGDCRLLASGRFWGGLGLLGLGYSSVSPLVPGYLVG